MLKGFGCSHSRTLNELPATFRTFNQHQFDFNNPSVDQINIGDIAVALSRMPRFGGHALIDYNVALHSLLVAALTPNPFKLAGLLHDGSEAYMGDIVSPLKHLDCMAGYRRKEEEIQGLIYEKFLGINRGVPAIVKEADYVAFRLEQAYFCNRGILSTDVNLVIPKGINVKSFFAEINQILFDNTYKKNSDTEFMNKFLEYGGFSGEIK